MNALPPEDEDLIRARQRSRARVTALLLGALVVLFFLISIAKIRSGTPYQRRHPRVTRFRERLLNGGT